MPRTPRTPVALAACAACLGLPLAAHAQPTYDTSAPAILQWFDSSYGVQEDRLADFFMAGYGSTWIPPVGRAQSGNLSVGYDPYDRFDLGSPGAPTLYGTETGLRTLNDRMHRLGGRVTVDLIWNHNGFADTATPGFVESGGYPGFFLENPDGGGDPFGVPNTDGDFHSGLIRYDDDDRRGRLAGLVDINHSVNFQAIRTPVDPNDPRNIPAGTSANRADPNNARFYPDRDGPVRMLFNPYTGQSDIPVYSFNKDNPLAGDAVEENALGLLMRNVHWLVQEIGVDGFRLDAARHFDPFVFDYFDQAVYGANDRPLLDGSQEHVFSYSESATTDLNYLQTFVRKDINPADPGRIGGNRDGLDFALFRAVHDNLGSTGFGNDWRNVAYAGLDYHDDGLINGSQGITFVQSHDDFGPGLMNTAYAFSLMRPGNALVYYNARQHGDERDFPKGGRGDALGNYGDTITTLTNLRDSHGRGDYRERWMENGGDLDGQLFAYERSGSALILLSNRGDQRFDSRTLQVDHPAGTYLVELTGNAIQWNNRTGNADIPEVIQAFDDNGISKVNVRFVSDGNNDAGYLIYGLPTPQSTQGVELSNVTQTLAGGSPDPGSNYENAVTRLTDLSVITADSFDVTLRTQAVNLLGSIRDPHADGDNALIKINAGLDLNGSGNVDYVTPNTVAYGFEEFTDTRSPGYDEATGTGGDGLFTQTIDTTMLPEGMNFVTVRAFRYRPDSGPGAGPEVFTDFKRAIYVDRLAPVSGLAGLVPFSENGHNIDFQIESLDQTADSVHTFLNLPANLSDADILALVDGNNSADPIDRDLFQRGYFDVKAGHNVLTVVTYEITGNLNVQRLTGVFINNGNGAGLGDVNHDGSITATDLRNGPSNFETFLYGQGSNFNPAADFDGNGTNDTQDLYLARALYPTVDAATNAAYRDVVTDRGNINGEFGTDAYDIDAVYDRIAASTTDWISDLDADGDTDQTDVDRMVHWVLGTEYGDANLDQMVSLADLQILADHWQESGSNVGWAFGDFTGDDAVTLADLQILSDFWGYNDNSGMSFGDALAIVGVPEPGTATLVLLLLPALARRRRAA